MSIYGCHNKPRPVANSTYLAQLGYAEPIDEGWGTFSRAAEYVEVESAFDTTDCQYTKQHAADPHCSGCVHRTKENA
jgi:hypothetical protein